MNGVDLVIILFMVLAAGSGARRGSRYGLLDLACVAGGLLLGLLTYPLGQWLLAHALGLPDLLAGPLGFALMVILAAGGTWYVGRLWATREEEPSRTSRVLGSLAGLALAAIGLGAFLVLMGTASSAKQIKPEWQGVPGQATEAPAEPGDDPISKSLLAQPLLEVVPLSLRALELTGLKVPRVVMVPRDFERDADLGLPRLPTFRPINFTRLGGSMCIKCRSPVAFLGYKRKGGSFPFPKFQCPTCGRTSDGCQTFEGFHAMYHACPFQVADRGGQLDCGVWTNNDWVIPKGSCPVCGRVLEAPPP